MVEKMSEYGFDERELKELLMLVSNLAEHYTGYESSSVSYERAQALMEAVLYCIGECGQADGVAYAGMTIRARYEAGLALLRKKVEKIRRIWNDLAGSFDDYGVKCLSDTVQKGIPEFLKWYDVTFAPQETLLTLDYPVFVDCSDKKGADAVYEYLCAIELEQRFLERFGKAHVRTVLERYDGHYEDLIENICSIVLMDTIGHIALRKPSAEDAGGFRETDRERLTGLFGKKTVPELEEIIRKMICMLCGQSYEGVRKLPDYLCLEAGNLAVRIHTAIQHDGCAGVFR